MSKLLKGVFQSAPQWDEAAFEMAHQAGAITSVRYNPLKPIKLENANWESEHIVPWSLNGRYLDKRPSFTLDPNFHTGSYYVQEASSMFVEFALKNILTILRNEQESLRLLDLCAAPGGKSTLIASLLEKEDVLVSNEVIQSRASILVENMTRWGQMNTWVVNNDPKEIGKLEGCFDVMVVDAPCSGSGLWRKDEKAIDEWTPENVTLCAQRQQRILADVLTALKTNGYLIYATCSFSVEEDEAILDWLAEFTEVENVDLKVPEEWGITMTESPKHHLKGYRFYPWKLKGEGFFLSALKIKAHQDTDFDSFRLKLKEDKKSIQKKKVWGDYLTCDFDLLENNDIDYALPFGQRKFFEYLKSHLYIKKAGIELGNLGAKEAIPAHALAMATDLNKEFVKSVELSKEDALKYLKKEEVFKDNPQKGWQLATYNGLGLGWGKWLPNRMNNNLPKNLRIRMELE